MIVADLNLQGIGERRTRIQDVLPASRILMNQALDAVLGRAEMSVRKNGIVKKELIYRWSCYGRAARNRRRVGALDVVLECRRA